MKEEEEVVKKEELGGECGHGRISMEIEMVRHGEGGEWVRV